MYGNNFCGTKNSSESELQSIALSGTHTHSFCGSKLLTHLTILYKYTLSEQKHFTNNCEAHQAYL